MVNRQGIDAFALQNAESVVGQFRSVKRKLRDIPHRRYRYEDVIFDKLAWVRDMLGYLQLDVASEVVERVVEANDVRSVRLLVSAPSVSGPDAIKPIIFTAENPSMKVSVKSTFQAGDTHAPG